MELTAGAGILGDDSVVVLEHGRRFAVGASYGRLRLLKTRCHGDTCLSLYSVAGGTEEANTAPQAAQGTES